MQHQSSMIQDALTALALINQLTVQVNDVTYLFGHHQLYCKVEYGKLQQKVQP